MDVGEERCARRAPARGARSPRWAGAGSGRHRRSWPEHRAGNWRRASQSWWRRDGHWPSRAATISELTDPEGASAHESLEAVAQELRDRFAVTIAVDTSAPQVDLEPRAREHVTRIAREAIANAARHGGAQNVVVSLTTHGRGVALRVVDDGCGIAQAHSDPVHDGFGLRSMRERAAALGGLRARRTGRTGWDGAGGRPSVSRQLRLLIADREATRAGIRSRARRGGRDLRRGRRHRAGDPRRQARTT